MTEQSITVNNLHVTNPGIYGYFLYKIRHEYINPVPIMNRLSLVSKEHIPSTINIPTFQVNLNMSKIIGMLRSDDGSAILFQERQETTGKSRLVELLPRNLHVGCVTISNINTFIDILHPNYISVGYDIPAFKLIDVSNDVHRYLHSLEGVSFPGGISDELMNLIMNLKPIPENFMFSESSIQ